MESAWEPLEGTPKTLNTLAQQLGLDTTQYQFVDVLGLDDDVLAMTIPPPTRCVAVILLYPTTDLDMEAFLARKGEAQDHKRCVFLKQTVGGTCGTLAVVHVIANSVECHSALAIDSPLSRLIQKQEDDKNSSNFENSNALSSWFIELDGVRQAHQTAVDVMREGKSNPKSRSGQRQGRHFVTWVHRGGCLWELNGRRREGPACRGTTHEKSFLKDTIWIVRQVFGATKDESIHLKCCILALICTGR
jgi:ubiquitin carboxyl-terminal hydrolase L3